MDLDPEKFVSVSESDLSPDSFKGVIEKFILEEGTDYGELEYSLEEKVIMVAKQIREKKAALIYDIENEVCSIVLQNL